MFLANGFATLYLASISIWSWQEIAERTQYLSAEALVIAEAEGLEFQFIKSRVACSQFLFDLI